MSSPMLIPIEDAARLLGVHPQSIRDQAHIDPKMLGFPVCVIGARVLIPKEPFYRFIGLEEVKQHANQHN